MKNKKTTPVKPYTPEEVDQLKEYFARTMKMVMGDNAVDYQVKEDAYKVDGLLIHWLWFDVVDEPFSSELFLRVQFDTYDNPVVSLPVAGVTYGCDRKGRVIAIGFDLG